MMGEQGIYRAHGEKCPAAINKQVRDDAIVLQQRSPKKKNNREKGQNISNVKVKNEET